MAREIRSTALAYVREEDRQQTLAAGYEMHVKKPVEPYSLAEAVARLGKRSNHH
jgi:CheY-like chemotaxis protein